MRSIADQDGVAGLIDRLAQSIRRDAARSGKNQVWALVGIRSRGDLIAQRLAERLKDLVGDRVGSLDITLYRDDLSEIGAHAVVRTTEITFDIDQCQVVLVDDVLMTGRSIRAAIQSLMDIGRPRRVWLAVLVDRGGRELPIAPDHAALDLTDGSVPIAEDEVVEVHLKPTDDKDEILIRRKEGRR
ncbi:MAG: bifunctional pyr operon transcriptional regulator/uracil phosphoribosyltransferase PyrR [Planctomycetes bacterium]|nr:bifunctional pyr operon transcriptional regulator/uracil phosphoribosyltransferase PyrR [Planctomycetota bacterium]